MTTALGEELLQRLKFIVRHDYANPTARVSLTRNECISILSYLGVSTHRTSIKTSEHCTTCFNDNNDSVPAEFVVITKYSKYYQHFCRHHMTVWLDLFMHKESGASRFIHYEIRRLK